MASSTPQPQQVYQTTTTSNIPEYAQPYFEELLQRGATEAQQPYQAYEDQRIATFDPAQEQAFGMYEDIATTQPAGLAEAQDVASQVAGYAPEFYQGAQFTGEAVQQYMDPYLQNVLDVQQAQTQRRFEEDQLARQQASVQTGAFGGSRQAVTESLARRDLEEQLALNEAQALSDAYRFGASQFETEQARLAAGAQTAAQTQLAAGQLGGTLAQQEQAMGLQSAQALEAVGAQRQALEQQQLQTAYQDFLNQRDWERQQLGLYSSLLHGMNIQPTQDVTYSAPAPNPYAQGLGAAAGLYGLTQTFQGVS